MNFSPPLNNSHCILNSKTDRAERGQYCTKEQSPLKAISEVYTATSSSWPTQQGSLFVAFAKGFCSYPECWMGLHLPPHLWRTSGGSTADNGSSGAVGMVVPPTSPISVAPGTFVPSVLPTASTYTLLEHLKNRRSEEAPRTRMCSAFLVWSCILSVLWKSEKYWMEGSIYSMMEWIAYTNKKYCIPVPVQNTHNTEEYLCTQAVSHLGRWTTPICLCMWRCVHAHIIKADKPMCWTCAN